TASTEITAPSLGDALPISETPAPLLGALALAGLGALALVELHALPEAALGVAGVAAGQGALLATALGWAGAGARAGLVAVALLRSEEHTPELQSRENLVCR